VAILQGLLPLTHEKGFVFPSERKNGRPMSENTINGALRRLGYATDEAGHGFRAMARTILDEVLGFRVEWIDMQFAHKVKDPNRRAYNRTAFLKGRKEMMQSWADYLDGLRRPAPSPCAEERSSLTCQTLARSSVTSDSFRSGNCTPPIDTFEPHSALKRVTQRRPVR
jgi:hypothetical protein